MIRARPPLRPREERRQAGRRIEAAFMALTPRVSMRPVAVAIAMRAVAVMLSGMLFAATMLLRPAVTVFLSARLFVPPRRVATASCRPLLLLRIAPGRNAFRQCSDRNAHPRQLLD